MDFRRSSPDEGRYESCLIRARDRGLQIRDLDWDLFQVCERDTGAPVGEPLVGIDELEDFLGVDKYPDASSAPFDDEVAEIEGRFS